MASGIRFNISGIAGIRAEFDKIAKDTRDRVNVALEVFARNVQADAKATIQRNSADRGALANSIQIEQGDLAVSVFSDLGYAAYVEFGTRKFAAAYVSSLPPDWQSYAAQFKGSAGGGADELFNNILEWVKRKGIVPRATKTASTGRVTKDSKQQGADDNAAAYAITLSILRNGIHAHPFLYPAYQKAVIQLQKDLEKIFK